MSNPDFPNPTPRMVFGAAAAIALTTLTMLVPQWLIAPVSAVAFFCVVYGISWIVQALQDNEWPL